MNRLCVLCTCILVLAMRDVRGRKLGTNSPNTIAMTSSFGFKAKLLMVLYDFVVTEFIRGVR